jgi:hypothetical protein
VFKGYGLWVKKNVASVNDAIFFYRGGVMGAHLASKQNICTFEKQIYPQFGG